MPYFYLSKNLPAKILGDKSKLSVKCRHFLSELVRQSVLNHAAKSKLHRIPIPARQGHARYGRHWKKMLCLLKDHKIIEIFAHSHFRGRACTCRLLDPYDREIEEIASGHGLNIDLNGKTPNSRFLVAENDRAIAWIRQSFNRTSLTKSVARMLEETDFDSNHAALCARITLRAVEDHDSNFIRKSKGRLFYAVTQLKKTFRKQVLIDGQATCEIDISSAQPRLHATLYREDDPRDERDRFEQLVAREDFYEHIASWIGFEGTREEYKEIAFRDLFYSHHAASERSALFRRFRKEFPILADRMLELKRTSRGALPILMQNREAAIILDGVCSVLADESIPVLTVHDSIIVKLDDAARATEVLLECWKNYVGSAARAKISH
jgi:hypothetical protein